MNHDHCVKLDVDHQTNQVIPEQLLRLMLGKEHVVRVLLLPDGLHLQLPSTARDFVHFYEPPTKSALVTPGNSGGS